jgi:signal-transduction protein with cAMP-binding, CBS, and nucleotidyltransferase domain
VDGHRLGARRRTPASNEDEGVLGAPVSQIMTSEVATCEITDEVNKLMALMTERRIRHVPVMTKGELTGVISIGDIVKKRIDELEFERDQLDHYVHQT